MLFLARRAALRSGWYWFRELNGAGPQTLLEPAGKEIEARSPRVRPPWRFFKNRAREFSCSGVFCGNLEPQSRNLSASGPSLLRAPRVRPLLPRPLLLLPGFSNGAVFFIKNQTKKPPAARFRSPAGPDTPRIRPPVHPRGPRPRPVPPSWFFFPPRKPKKTLGITAPPVPLAAGKNRPATLPFPFAPVFSLPWGKKRPTIALPFQTFFSNLWGMAPAAPPCIAPDWGGPRPVLPPPLNGVRKAWHPWGCPGAGPPGVLTRCYAAEPTHFFFSLPGPSFFGPLSRLTWVGSNKTPGDPVLVTNTSKWLGPALF